MLPYRAIVLVAGLALTWPAAGRCDSPPRLKRGTPARNGPARLDRHGDPLPPGALARLGTVRFRQSGGTGGLAVSPDGKLAASWGFEGVRLWELATGRENRRFRPGTGLVPYSVCFSPDGKLLASFSNDFIVRLRDVATGKVIRKLKVGEHWGTPLAFSPAGKLLMGGSGQTGSLQIWDPATGKQLKTVAGHETPPETDGMTFLGLVPGGKVLAFADHPNKRICLWDVARRKQISEIANISSGALAFSPNGRLLALGDSAYREIHLWDTITGKLLHRLRAPKRNGRYSSGYRHSLSFSPDGRTLASGGDLRVALWETLTGRLRCVIGGPDGRSDCVVFASDGRTLICGSDEGAIRLWDVLTGKEIRPLSGPYGDIRLLAFLPDGDRLVTAERGAPVRLWRLSSGKEIGQFLGDERDIESLVVSADGKRLATVVDHGGGDPDVYFWLWDVAQRRRLRRFVPGDQELTRIALSPDGKTLAAGRYGRIHLWDLASGKKVRVLRHAHRAWIDPLVYSPDGGLLAAATYEDKGIRLWDANSGKELRRLDGFPGQVSALSFSPDGRMLVVNGWRSDFKLYEVASGRELRVFSGHTDLVDELAFAPDGRTLASASRDGTIRLWRLTTGKEFHRIVPSETPGPIAYSPDGQRLACGVGPTVVIWDAGRAVREAGTDVRPLDKDERERLWRDLARAHVYWKYQAEWRLCQAGGPVVAFLASRLHPARTEDAGVASPEQQRTLHAIKVLEYMGTVEAKRVLVGLAQGAVKARLTREATAALARLAGRPVNPPSAERKP